jgi:alcohol dehydrogenase (cytochrome c)
MKTNRLVWRQAWQAPCFSGSVTTGGGLVFVGRNDGRLTALDSSNGKRLWDFQTGAGLNAPASVFSFGGEEYIAAYSAGNALIGSTHGDSLWLFSLKGTLAPVTGSTEAPANSDSGPSATADLEKGGRIFAGTCSACHGASGEGGHGPSLKDVGDLEKIVLTVKRGGAQMPSFASKLTEEDIRDVSVYVHEKLSR